MRVEHLQLLRLLPAGGPVTDIFTVTDLDGVIRIKINHVMIFHVDGWHAVIGSRNQPGVIKSGLQRARCDLPIIIRSPFAAQPEVPLPDDRCSVACPLHDKRESVPAGFYQRWCHPAGHTRSRFTPGILTCEKGVAAGWIGRWWRITIGDMQPFIRALFDVRCFHFTAIAADIPITHILCIDEYDVGCPVVWTTELTRFIAVPDMCILILLARGAGEHEERKSVHDDGLR